MYNFVELISQCEVYLVVRKKFCLITKNANSDVLVTKSGIYAQLFLQ